MVGNSVSVCVLQFQWVSQMYAKEFPENQIKSFSVFVYSHMQHTGSESPYEMSSQPLEIPDGVNKGWGYGWSEHTVFL